MERVKIKSVSIHSDKDQNERDNAMKLFHSGEVKMLVATDVSARGIDIPNVDYVVNYDLPEQVENYVHRIGRTGRGTSKGNAVSFCSESELELLKEIEEYIGYEIPELEVSKGDYQETLDFTDDTNDNWKKLIADSNKPVGKRKKK